MADGVHRPAIAVMLVSLLVPFPVLAEPTPARQAELRELVVQDCGSCHGMTLKGGLGAPLNPADLAAYTPESVVETILDGRPGTPMPPWRTMISRDEAQWIAGFLMGERQ